MRRLLAAGLATALIIAAACDSFDDADVPDTGDSGPDATTDAGADVADAQPTDGGLLDAEGGIPPGMVLITAGSPFFIDAREVTYGEFSDFKEKVIAAGGDAGFPGVCDFKLGVLGPATSVSCTHATRDIPVRCVDWCDAYAYCAAAGKRLCGRIGGTGSVGPGTDDVDPFLAEWARACAGGTSTTDRWPYGDAPDANACNTEEQAGAEPSDAGGYPGCVGAVPGLFDMSGNVAEIDDSCSGDAGQYDSCRVHGGSFYDGIFSCKCNSAPLRARGDRLENHGFRCCKSP